MADTYEFSKEKKKRTYKKIDKDFNTFETEKMKTPGPSNYTKQTPSFRFNNKSSYLSSNSAYEDQSNNFQSSYWDKRNSRRYQGDGEFRSSYGGKPWRYYEGTKEGYRSDAGKPGTEESTLDSAAMVTPVILMREKSTLQSKTQSSTSSHMKENEMSNCEPVPAPVPNHTPTTPVPTPNPAPTPAPTTLTPTRQYQIVSKPNILEAVVIPEQELSSSVKLLDDSLMLGEDFSPYLLDQSHFLVIAVVGLQGAGKSTIASLLAHPLKGHKFTMTRSWLFRPESREEVLRGCHSTSGVDAFVTRERVILLDLQPLLSPSVMDYVVTQERKASLDYSSTENLLEVESLQLLTFAMSVAHVLVVVQDYILHPNLIRLLHTCQMMKPSHSTTGSHNAASSSSSSSSSSPSPSSSSGNRATPSYDAADTQQFFPHLVFVHNRAFPHQFMPKCVEELQVLYQATLGDSNLGLESQVGVCSGTFSPPLGARPSGAAAVNLFLIPDVNSQDNCAVSFVESIQEMRRQLFSLSRCPLTHVTLTEKSWYQYACRMWESIRKSNLYVEYSRLLP